MAETKYSPRSAPSHAKRRRKKKGSAEVTVIAVLLFIIIALVAVIIIVRSGGEAVYKSNVLEAGDIKLTPEMFLKDGTKEIAFAEGFDPSEIDTRTPGTYEVKLVSGGRRYTSSLVIQDTVAPKASPRPAQTALGVEIKPEELVRDLSDNSYIFSVAFENTPDFSTPGEQNVNIVITDAGGNKTTVASVLTVLEAGQDVPVVGPVDDPAEDTEAPVIFGVHDITIYVGEGISYFSGVYAEDNVDGNVQVTVEADSVNTKAAGKYTITYYATDAAGNTASKTAKVTIIVRSVEEQTVLDLAESVLKSIITDDMTGYQKLSAIYKWVRSNVSWYDSSDKDDWVKAAYQGLHDGRGDCFVYQMVSKVLLDAAGIDNKLIDTQPLRYLHCWNLVNIGEGWYHFDTTPRKGGFDGLYLDDETLMAYSETHSNSHIYDHEKYPDVVVTRP